MTESLLLLLVYLTLGCATTGFLRFVGLPDIGHEHVDDKCWTDDYYDSSNRYYPRILNCNARLGGEPFQIILWIIWTFAWPLAIAGVVIGCIVWIAFKGLWTEI